MNLLNNIPKPLLVISVFVLGIAFIVYTNRPHSICDTQLENFKELEKGYLYPLSIKNAGTRAPIYDRAFASCRDGQGSAGACLEYFKILSKMIADLDPIASTCGEFFGENGVIRKSLIEGMRTLILIAWGEELPDKEAKVSGRLDTTELSLFCNLRATWLKYLNKESFESFKDSVVAELPTKKFEMKEGARVCTNCETPPKLLEVMGSREELLKHTLFSINCYSYH